MPIATAATWATRSTVTSGRMRDCSPPMKSASPQHTEDEKARTTATTPPNVTGLGPAAAGTGLRAGGVALAQPDQPALGRRGSRSGQGPLFALPAPVEQ